MRFEGLEHKSIEKLYPFILIQITEDIAVSPTKSSDYQWLDKNSKRNKI